MDKQIDTPTQWNITHKKEQSTNTCYNVNEPPKYYAKWKKPDTKCHILYDHIYMRYPE